MLEDDPELFPHATIPKAAITDTADRIAVRERRHFGVTMEMQRRWRPNDEPFRKWRQRAQDLGLLVLVKKMPWGDCRGLSLWGKDLVPTIVVNSEDSFAARCFTLFHEYGHLMLRDPGVCVEIQRRDQAGRTEGWCNAFAAAFVVPEDELRRAVTLRFGALHRDEWTIADIQKLAAEFRVSRHVVARRLKELNISRFYDLHGDELYKLERSPPRKTKDRPFPIRPEVLRLSEVGAGAANAILEAVRGEAIDAADAADVLNLRLDQLRGFEERAEVQRIRDAPG
ncbi:MAG: ImmA/IrrE family metallo-endopeptidase [Dehalococcoidia bacterium]